MSVRVIDITGNFFPDFNTPNIIRGNVDSQGCSIFLPTGAEYVGLGYRIINAGTGPTGTFIFSNVGWSGSGTVIEQQLFEYYQNAKVYYDGNFWLI